MLRLADLRLLLIAVTLFGGAWPITKAALADATPLWFAVSRTLLGALVIQLVRYTLLANGVPDAAALVVKAGLIVVAVYVQQRADRS